MVKIRRAESTLRFVAILPVAMTSANLTTHQIQVSDQPAISAKKAVISMSTPIAIVVI